MLSDIIGSNRKHKAPVIWCFNRRWADWQAMKVLMLHSACVHMSEDGGSVLDAWIMAIDQVAQSGLVYDTTIVSIEDICQTVSMENDKAPGKLLIVDGLEYFQSNSKEESSLSKLPEMLDQLRTLAQETMLPVIASTPPLHLLEATKSLVATDYIIELHDKDDDPLPTGSTP